MRKHDGKTDLGVWDKERQQYLYPPIHWGGCELSGEWESLDLFRGGITKNLEGGEAVELFDFANNSLNDMKISAKVIEVTSDYQAKEVLVFSFNDPDPTSYAGGYRVYQAERYPLYHPFLLK